MPNNIPGWDTTTGLPPQKALDALGGVFVGIDGNPGQPKILDGVRGYAAGNSYVGSNSGGITSYMTRVMDMLGVSSYSNFATNGYRMQDTARSLSAVTAKTWPASQRGIMILNDFLNNLIEADNSLNRAAALEGARVFAALVQSTGRIEQTNPAFVFSTSPSWTVQSTQAFASGGNTAITGAEGGFVDITVPAGTSYLLSVGTNGVDFRGQTLTVTQGGTTIASKLMDKLYIDTSFFNNHVGPAVIRLPNLAAGTIRVTGSQAGLASSFAWVDALLPQSAATTPLIFMVKPLPVLASSHTTGKADLLTYLRTIPDTIRAEFGDRVVVIDPIAGWDPNTMLLSDGLHPNEAGAVYLANFVSKAVAREMLRLSRLATASAFSLV